MAKPTVVAGRERPILFSGEMVRAIMEGRKTVTRRVLAARAKGLPVQPLDVLPMPNRNDVWCALLEREPSRGAVIRCRYGAPGDRLWVREAHAFVADELALAPGVAYRAGGDSANDPYGNGIRWFRDEAPQFVGRTVYNAAKPEAWRWRRSIHMPRWASRLTLEVVDVRVERLWDITEADAEAEGFTATREELPWGGKPLFGSPDFTVAENPVAFISASGNFQSLWRQQYGDFGDAGWEMNPWVWRIGFRLLDGRTHDEFPASPAEVNRG